MAQTLRSGCTLGPWVRDAPTLPMFADPSGAAPAFDLRSGSCASLLQLKNEDFQCVTKREAKDTYLLPEVRKKWTFPAPRAPTSAKQAYK